MGETNRKNSAQSPPKSMARHLNLKIGFTLLTLLLFIVSAAAVTWAVGTLAEGIIEQWAQRYLVKQALYDKSRTLRPIMREVALSRQLATSRFIREWARHPDDPGRTQNALDELENFRKNFKDNSYFVALRSNGRYYHNNAANQYAGKELRYVLDPEKPSDAWFFDLIRQNRDIHINVNPDLELGITKLWIDVLIRDGNDILGMAGTGLDLTEFLKNVVEEAEPGMVNFFADHSGAIQIHRNTDLIDFGSVSKKWDSQKTIELIFQRPEDQTAIYAEMKQLEAGKKSVATSFVQINGRRHLAGIVYLPEIDWHEISLIDLGRVLPLSQFSTIILVYVATLLAVLILFHFTLNRLVLTPLAQLDRAMAKVKAGQAPHDQINAHGVAELGRLIDRFLEMADAVLESRRDLEQKVKDRTLDLERLARIDSLTELLNRRGMTELMAACVERARREKTALGILYCFKAVNDKYGHGAGDEALKTVAQIIRSEIRPYDAAARWGGDEFLVIMQPADTTSLAAIGERICLAVAEHEPGPGRPALSVSVGGSLSCRRRDLDALLQHADQALYRAKAAGRNCFRAYRPDPPDPG